MKLSMSILFWGGLFGCGEVDSSVSEPKEQMVETEGTAIENEMAQGPLVVKTKIQPDTVRLGDPFTLSLSVESRGEVEIEMPPFGEALGRLSILNFTPRQDSQIEDGITRTVQQQIYELQPNRSGEVVIPSLRVGYRTSTDTDWQEVLTAAIPVQVTSILPTDGDLVYQTSRARLAPLPVEQPWIPWAVGGVLALGVVGGAFWWFGRRSERKIQLSAFEQALEQLQGLEDTVSTLVEGDSIDEVYAGLSQVLRGYLERRFAISALEQTTEELKEGLAVNLATYAQVVSAVQVEQMLTFLTMCDGVKFAGRQKSLVDARADWAQVKAWIDSIHRHSEQLRINQAELEGNDGVV